MLGQCVRPGQFSAGRCRLWVLEDVHDPGGQGPRVTGIGEASPSATVKRLGYLPDRTGHDRDAGRKVLVELQR